MNRWALIIAKLAIQYAPVVIEAIGTIKAEKAKQSK